MSTWPTRPHNAHTDATDQAIIHELIRQRGAVAVTYARHLSPAALPSPAAVAQMDTTADAGVGTAPMEM